MKMKKNRGPIEIPKTSEIEQVYRQASYRKRLMEAIRSTVFMLIVVAAFAVLIAVLFLVSVK